MRSLPRRRAGESGLEYYCLIRSVVEDTQRRRKPLQLVWFNLRSAFGLVSHGPLWLSMRSIGLPEEMLSIMMGSILPECYVSDHLSLPGSPLHSVSILSKELLQHLCFNTILPPPIRLSVTGSSNVAEATSSRVLKGMT